MLAAIVFVPVFVKYNFSSNCAWSSRNPFLFMIVLFERCLKISEFCFYGKILDANDVIGKDVGRDYFEFPRESLHKFVSSNLMTVVLLDMFNFG